MLSSWKRNPIVSVAHSKSHETTKVMLVVILITLGILIGILFGHSLFHRTCTNIKVLQDERESKTIKEAFSLIDVDRIKNNFMKVSKEPHLAGSERDDQLAEYVFKEWSDIMDSVRVDPYTVLLSYPDPDRANSLSIKRGKSTVFEASFKEIDYLNPLLDPVLTSKEFPQAFVAYSPSGNITTTLVYANYGREEDFDLLHQNYSSGVDGSVCLLRIGHISTGEKIMTAERRGCAGVLLYPDPELVAPGEDLPYPDSMWLPHYGIRRASAYYGTGDPLTPLQPAIDGVHRIAMNDSKIPKIPSQSISYGDAAILFSYMAGDQAPPSWRGKLKEDLYKLGPGFLEQDLKVNLVVQNIFRNVTIKNVMGKLTGTTEPDRMVIHGSHRDSFAFGASQPGTGHSQMLEVARVFATMVKTGWRPKRTIVFASWSGRKFGAIGSREFVEENLAIVSRRCMAYLNTDACAAGDVPEFVSSPSLYHMVLLSSKLVPDPINPGRSLYRSWRDGHSTPLRTSKQVEMIGGLGYHSDIGAFEFYGGVPVTDVTFRHSNFSFHFSEISPVQDTALDNAPYVTILVDPEFKIQKACTQMNIVMLVKIADSLIAPINPRYVAKMMKMSLHRMENDYKEVLSDSDIDLIHLNNAIEDFAIAAKVWLETAINSTKLLEGDSEPCWSCLNDQNILAERALLSNRGLPGRPELRHVLASPSDRSGKNDAGFVGIQDNLYRISNSTDPKERLELITTVKEHLSECIVMVKMATKILLTFDII